MKRLIGFVIVPLVCLIACGGSGIHVPAGGATYNQTVLADHPVAFWNINQVTGAEPDLSGNNNTGTYKGGTPTITAMPNGDQVAVFNGSTECLTIPSNASFSIPTTGNLTWGVWIKPSTLQFPGSGGSGGDYVAYMGKCDSYSGPPPTCEWEARMYNTTNSENRCNRLSAYAFNPGAGLGSGGDWQPVCSLLQANEWLHVVGEYTTKTQYSDCPNSSSYPGELDIWMNGVEWNHSYHGATGCMSQYNVVPVANNSPLNIGTMAYDTWFQGAIGKVAIYNYLLSQMQITNHYKAMTRKQPTGSCADTCTF